LKTDARKNGRYKTKSGNGFREPLRAAGSGFHRSIEQRQRKHSVRGHRAENSATTCAPI